MFKPTRAEYSIKSCPSGELAQLEELLNSMSANGWELYSMHEVEADEGYQFNCIFVRDSLPDETQDDSDIIGFKSKMERIMNPVLEPYDMCIDIQKKIREKRQKINNIKSLLDSTPEDSRTGLNREISVNIQELADLKKKLINVVSPDIMDNKIGQNKLSISLSEELLDVVDPDSQINLISKIVGTRQKLTQELGYIIPKVNIESDDSLQANEFSIKIRGISAFNAFAYPGFIMYFKDALNLSKLPKGTIKDIDYISGKDILWIEESKTKDFWAKGLNSTDFIARLLEFASVKHIEDIFDYSDVNRYIEIVGTQNLYLIENIIPDYLSIAELKYILTSLIKEKISIRDIMFIFEKINDFADEPSKEDLLARMRVALARIISSSLANKSGMIQAFSLDDESISYLIEQSDDPDVIKLDATKLEKISSNIQKGIKKFLGDEQDIILITPMHIRHIVYLVLSQYIPNIKVVAKEELLFDYPLEIIDYV